MGTFIVAGRGSDGVVVISDRRVVDRQRLELISDTERKAFAIAGKVVLAFDGSNAIWSDILREVEDAFQDSAVQTFEDAVAVVRRSLRKTWQLYAAAFPQETQFNAFVAALHGLTAGAARLAMVGPMGIVDEVPAFQCGGMAGLQSQSLVRLLWNTEWPVRNLWAVGVFCCAYAATFDLTVGGVPIVYLVRDGQGIEEIQADKVGRVVSDVHRVAGTLQVHLKDELPA